MSKTSVKKPWEKVRLTRVGNVADVVRVGGGKLTGDVADPGEPLKTQPSEG